MQSESTAGEGQTVRHKRNTNTVLVFENGSRICLGVQPFFYCFYRLKCQSGNMMLLLCYFLFNMISYKYIFYHNIKKVRAAEKLQNIDSEVGSQVLLSMMRSNVVNF